MAHDEASTIVLQGAAVWNAWRDRNPAPLLFSRPRWYDSPGRGGVQLKGGNRLDFSGINLSGAMILGAFAEGLNLRGAIFDGTVIDEGDFSRANLSGATFRNTKFNKTIFTDANFDGATFVNCNLNRINLAGASFRVKEITETVIYGISAWDLTISADSRQSKLVIEKSYELYSDLIQQGKIPMMVDDIELAQFIYYLSDHKRLRGTLNILNEKGVLLLGRFKDGGLERLYTLRQFLQDRGYMAMIFDFTRPDNLSFTETIVTMAGLAKFVIADLSGPSVGEELHAIFAEMKKPVFTFGGSNALSGDLADRTGAPILRGDEANLVASLEANLPALEKLHAERVLRLAVRYNEAK
jgi:uncharacterized protein YjbI with pentapeptide repeats